MGDIKKTMTDYLAELGLLPPGYTSNGQIVIKEPADYWIPNHPVIDNHAAVLYLTSDPPQKIQWPEEYLN